MSDLLCALAVYKKARENNIIYKTFKYFLKYAK